MARLLQSWKKLHENCNDTVLTTLLPFPKHTVKRATFLYAICFYWVWTFLDIRTSIGRFHHDQLVKQKEVVRTHLDWWYYYTAINTNQTKSAVMRSTSWEKRKGKHMKSAQVGCDRSVGRVWLLFAQVQLFVGSRQNKRKIEGYFSLVCSAWSVYYGFGLYEGGVPLQTVAMDSPDELLNCNRIQWAFDTLRGWEKEGNLN